MVKKKSTNKGKGGPVTKLKKQEILLGLKNIIDNSNGDIELKYDSLAEMYNTTRQTISNYVDELYSNVPEEDINKTFIDFRMIFRKLHREMDRLFEEAITVRERLEVIKTYVFLMEKKTDLLEKYFKKAKAEENININADITQKQVVINYNVPNGTITD